MHVGLGTISAAACFAARGRRTGFRAGEPTAQRVHPSSEPRPSLAHHHCKHLVAAL